MNKKDKFIFIIGMIYILFFVFYMKNIPMRRFNVVNAVSPAVFKSIIFYKNTPNIKGLPLIKTINKNDNTITKAIKIYDYLHKNKILKKRTLSHIPFFLKRLVNKIGKSEFSSDEYAALFMLFAKENSMISRCVYINSLRPFKCSYAVEFLYNDKWVYFDPVYGIFAKNNKEYLSLLEIKQSIFYKNKFVFTKERTEFPICENYLSLFSYIYIVDIDFNFPVISPFSTSVVYYNYAGVEGKHIFIFKKLFIFIFLGFIFIFIWFFIKKIFKYLNSKFDKQFLNKLYIILFIGFLLRAGYSFVLAKTAIFPDEHRYIEETVRFIYGFGPTRSDTFLICDMPLLNYIMSIPVVIFGVDFDIIRLFQCIISIIHIIGIMICIWICSKNKNTVILAGIVSAFYPFFIFFTPYFLTENLYITLIVFSILTLIMIFKEESIKYSIIAGFLMGLSIFTRPIIMIFPIFSVLIFLKFKPKNYIKLFSVYIICSYILLVPWVIRNYTIFHKFILTTNVGGQTLYFGNNPKNITGGGKWGVDFKFPKEALKGGEYKQDQVMRKMAIEYIVNNPKKTIKNMIKRFFRLWNIVPNAAKFQKLRYKLASIGSFGLFLFLSFLYVVKNKFKDVHTYIFVLFFFYISFFHSIFIASVRYRLPAETFIIILGSLFIIENIFNKYIVKFFNNRISKKKIK